MNIGRSWGSPLCLCIVKKSSSRCTNKEETPGGACKAGAADRRWQEALRQGADLEGSLPAELGSDR
eukprot:320568-Hanusia_phi.AAC.1